MELKTKIICAQIKKCIVMKNIKKSNLLRPYYRCKYSIFYLGNAQIRNAEFFHSGQEGWTDSTDPRFSVTFLNLGKVHNTHAHSDTCAAFHSNRNGILLMKIICLILAYFASETKQVFPLYSI